MKITEVITQNEPEVLQGTGYDPIKDEDPYHKDELKKTGFWGKQGAGVLFLAMHTGRIGLSLRSAAVEQPGTWGNVGGAIEKGADPESTAIQEASEETGYRQQPGDYVLPLDVFQQGTFRYTTFLFVVGTEFKTRGNWESDAFEWFSLDNLPQPLHFGITATLAKPQCMQIIQTEIQKHQAG